MPKPTETDLRAAVNFPISNTAIREIMELIDRAWEGAPQADATPEDFEQHNREQRIRREAYAEALNQLEFVAIDAPDARAARRYPLRKRVPKVIGDPHGPFKWTVRYDRQCETWHAVSYESLADRAGEGWPPGTLATPERPRVLAALLEDPWTYEEDTSVEGSD